MLRMRLLMNQRLLPKSDRFCIGTFRSIRLESSSFRSINQQPLSAKESFNGLDSTSNHSFPTTWNSDHAIAESDGSTVFSTEDSTVFESFNQFLDDKMCSFSNEVFEVAEHITQESQNQVDRPVHRKRNIDRMYMSMHFKQTILPYLHACVNSTMTDRAFSTVNWYNFKNGMFDNCDASMIRDVCNVLLKGYALENRLNGLHEVFKVMRHFDVQPDLKSYAWYLYILSKNNRIKLATNVIAKMEHDGLVLSDMFCQSNLNLDQRFVVQKFIHKFKPQLAFTDLQVNNEPGCEIVKDLYDRPRSEYVPMKRFDLTEFRSALDEQMEMEKQGRVTIKSVYETKATGQTQFCRDELTRLEQEWKTVLVASLKQNLQVIQNKYSDMNGMNVYPYLCSLDLNATVDMMVDEAIMLGRMNGTYSPPSYINYLNLGRRIQNHYLTQILLKNFPEGIELYESYLKYYTDPELIGRLNTREHWQKLAVEKRLYASPDVKDMTWPYAIIISIGKMMYEIMLRELKIDANLFKETHKKRMVPAFLTIYTRDKVKLQEEIRCNVAFSKLFQEAQMDKIYFDPSMLPMLVPPVPWINPKRGGYLFTNVEIIRENLNEVAMCRDKLQNRNLNTIYDALNVVSMCPWKVNQPVLDVMIEIFNQNGNVDLDIPIHNSSMPQPQSAKDCNNKEERVALIRKRFKQRKENTEMYSLWCECQYKLSIANHFRDRIFWFPHNLDFRGRVYPFPPHFNHLGGDLSRGMLLFGEGKPLGPDGFKWLKIHLVNLTGLMKRKSLDERAEYADQIMEDIIDSADNPLTGRKWWQASDEPWQTLACCMEIRNVLRSGLPTHEYVSSFPVHQDGSCNGLQHYAALGRDQEGARSVNLEPNDVPCDVYSDVAALVEADRQQDAADGSEIAQLLEGRVGRKVVKTTVMTYVYGVTVYGAKLQIFKNMKDLKDFPEEHRWKASLYLTQKVFLSILKMFKSTKAIQDWLTLISIGVSKNLNLPVEWVTPLGLPVIQPYLSKESTADLASKISASKVKVNSLKQKNGFPPNYIHSLDSSHMMLTALHCEHRGIAFVSVHDSFWTHPCSVNDMGQICRQQFVNLHSQNLLQDLSEHFVRQYSLSNSDRKRSKDKAVELIKLFQNVPERGTFQLENVLQSTYFFS